MFRTRARSTIRASVLIAATLTYLTLAASLAGAPTAKSAEVDGSGAPFVTLEQQAISVPTDSSFSMTANIIVDRPTSYLEARLQIRQPGGRLMFQKTEVRSNLDTGTVVIDFGRALEDLGVAPGSYPVDLRVRTQSDTVRQWDVASALLIHDPAAVAVPVAVVTRIEAAPTIDAEGRFSIDPANSTRARDEAIQVAQLILDNPSIRLSLAIPPVTLEEWLRISQGYEHASPDGVLVVPKDDPVALEYGRALQLLKRAFETRRLELLTVPYALPDLGAIDEPHRAADLEAHLLRGRSACLAALETSPSPVLFAANGLLPSGSLETLADRDIRACLVTTESVSADTDAASGAYMLRSAPKSMSALVFDPTASEALRSGEVSTLIASVFERSLSDTPTAPVIAQVALGPGREARISDVRTCLEEMAAAPWAHYVTATEAAGAKALPALELTASVPPVAGAPVGFWSEITAARSASAAFLGAVGVNDPDAQIANDLSLVAQSALWAGPDLNWGSADRGRVIAAAAQRSSRAVLDAVTLVANDITLSSASGPVPVSISNASQKNLSLRLEAKGRGVTAGPLEAEMIQVRPQENLVTVPVDLGQSLRGDVTVQLWADDQLIDETVVVVRASFLDRLVMIAGAALVLVGMLLFIRHRVRSATRADTM